MNKKRSTSKSIGSAFTTLFCAGLLAAILADKLSPIAAGFYSLMSLLTFIAYAVDKFSAKHGHWRTPEKTLHILGFVGGWPGAFFAQKLLHHKSKKQTFKGVFWVTVILNLACFFWLCSERGTRFLIM